jgi:hypothetical protein
LRRHERIETFANYPNIAIVGEGAFNADIGGKSNTRVRNTSMIEFGKWLVDFTSA